MAWLSSEFFPHLLGDSSVDVASRVEFVLEPPSAFEVVVFGQHHFIASDRYMSCRSMGVAPEATFEL